MTLPESEFGFDRDRSFGSKIGNTFLLLVIGVVFFLFTALAFHPKENPWWLILLEIAIEICWTFWLSAIAFVWFDIPWLRYVYLRCEKRFVGLAKIAIWGLPFFAIGTYGLVWYLFHIGILPLAPR
ncbi:MAG: hypothetical protein ACKVII_19940 [Planctomycetales bacterium]|jgi:hypothetical protein